MGEHSGCEANDGADEAIDFEDADRVRIIPTATFGLKIMRAIERTEVGEACSWDAATSGQSFNSG